jgi:hypothetical protein
MLLGFILPFALAFIAVPLESLIHSARAVGGVLAVGLVGMLAFALRLLANLTRHASRALINLYDVFIVLPLLVERLTKGARGSQRATRAARGSSRAIDPDETEIATHHRS